MNTPLPLDETQQWYDDRRKGIGASDAAAVLGLSPWSSPFDVWREKVGEDTTIRTSLQMYVGKRLQDTVGDLYVMHTGRRIRADNKRHERPGMPYMFAHLDFRELGNPRRLVECKTAYSDHGFGDDGSTVIPIQYWVQAQHEMAVVNADVCDLAVLFGHRDFRVFPIVRDDVFIPKLTDAIDEFWNTYVVTRQPPPVDHTEAARQFMARRHPNANGVTIPATPEQAELGDRYRQALEAVDVATKERDRIKNRIIQLIGDNDGIRAGDWSATYRNVKPSDPVTNFAAVADWALDIMRAVDEDEIRDAVEASGAIPDDHPVTSLDDAIEYVKASNTVPGRKGYRRFDWDDRKEVVE